MKSSTTDPLTIHFPLKPKLIAFSGSRTLPPFSPGTIRTEIDRITGYKRWQVEIVHGCCVGVDELIAWWAWEHRLRVHGVCPPDTSKVFDKWRDLCTSWEKIHDLGPGDKTGYKRRNQRMVDLADHLIAFPLHEENDERSRYSGTWQTIRLAKKALIPVEVFVLSEIARRS